MAQVHGAGRLRECEVLVSDQIECGRRERGHTDVRPELRKLAQAISMGSTPRCPGGGGRWRSRTGKCQQVWCPVAR